MAHFLYIEDDDGELIDCVNLCTDSCHRTYAKRVGIEYGGWNGAQELEFTDWCANCGVVIPGFEGESGTNELCGDQDRNVIVNRFRSETGEKCEMHNGAHWVQLPASHLIGDNDNAEN